MLSSHSTTSALVHFGLVLSVNAAATYTWPSKTDFLESLLYEQFGRDVDSPATFIAPCGIVRIGEGRSAPAEWLRTAFHDMATADVETGIGGLDASIAFETNRDENPGAAFNETFNILSAHFSAHSSMADLLALGTAMTAGTCSNSKVIVPMRSGRIDATGPGPAGVPRPEEDIQSHINAFKRQGFNKEEMIGLVACGHTLGGVHGKSFPEIVDVPANDTTGGEFTVTFDKTVDGTGAFDNKVATDFVANKTQNPLAFGHNETTNSDGRIFNSDGGKYIHKLAASNDFFLDTCADLLERMINVVPKGVTLTEPILPVEVKPLSLYASISSKGTMEVVGLIRLIDQMDPNPDRSVTVEFQPRTGAKPVKGDYVVAKAIEDAGSWTRALYGQPPEFPVFKRYAFKAQVPVSTGISKFNVVVTDKVNGKPKTTKYTNNGKGFAFDDTVLTQPKLSCQDLNHDGKLNLTVAIRNDAQLTSLKANIQVPSDIDALVPSVKTIPVTFKKVGAAGDKYTLYNAVHKYKVGGYVRTYDLVASNGKKTVESKFNEMIGLPDCKYGKS